MRDLIRDLLAQYSLFLSMLPPGVVAFLGAWTGFVLSTIAIVQAARIEHAHGLAAAVAYTAVVVLGATVAYRRWGRRS